MLKLSNYFYKNLLYTFTQMLNEKTIKFKMLEVIKTWVASKYTAQQTSAAKKKDNT